MPLWLLVLACLGISVVLQGCSGVDTSDLSKLPGCQMDASKTNGGPVVRKRQESDRPAGVDSEGSRRSGCPMIYVPMNDTFNKQCEDRGIKGSKEADKPDEEEAKFAAGSYKPFQVRAVKYGPRPVGKVGLGSLDLYTDEFREIYRRDLLMISSILKANTIRLAPWQNDVSHKHFLDACREFGLYVIPTFDLDYFFRTEEWRRKASYYELEKKVIQHFNEFIKNVAYEEPVLMWSINYAPYLNETITRGHETAKKDDLNVYAQLLKALRGAHYLHEWNRPGNKDAYLRPLALPIRLDTQKEPADVGWYMAIMESEWAAWPEKRNDQPPHGLRYEDFPPDQLTEKKKKELDASFEALKEAGSFDVWIAETMPQTKDEGSMETALSLMLFNDSIVDPEEHQVYPNCNDDDCMPPPTTKAAILQYGFSALVERSGQLSKREVDVDIQQHYIKDVWKAIVEKQFDRFAAYDNNRGDEDEGLLLKEKLKYTCVRGGIIDEWNDDWDRCATMGYASQGFVQNKGGVCDELKKGHLVHVEWFGLNAQYSFMGFHCLEPRFDSRYGNEQDERKDLFGFRFDLDSRRTADYVAKEQLVWKDVHYCRIFLPKLYKIVEFGISLVIVIFIWLVTRCCRNRRKKRDEGEDEDEDETSRMKLSASASSALGGRNSSSDIDVMAFPSGRDVRSSTIDIAKKENGEENGTRKASDDVEKGRAEDSFSAEAQAYFPRKLLIESLRKESDSPMEASTHVEFFCIKLTAATHHADNKKQMWMHRVSEKQVKAHLDCHLRTQELRLYHQLETEAYAVQAIEKADLQKCFPIAMCHIHARAMEGYIAWLERRNDHFKADKITTEGTRFALEKITAFTRSSERGSPERPWEMWTQALLLRVIESLSEMGIHAPEFLAAFYHDVLTTNGQNDGTTKPFEFTIDYNALHNPIEKMRENSNPYRGGINFDDMNDEGYRGRKGSSNADHDVRLADTNVRTESPTELPKRIDEWKKTFNESASTAVLLDILANFQPVFTLKIWLLLLAWYLYLGEDPRNGGGASEGALTLAFWTGWTRPKFQRQKFVMFVGVLDSYIGFMVELAILFHGIWQGRCRWTGKNRWVIRRTCNTLVTGGGAAALTMFVNPMKGFGTLDYNQRVEDLINQEYTEEEFLALICVAGYLFVRVIVFILLTRSFRTGMISFMPGRPDFYKTAAKYIWRLRDPTDRGNARPMTRAASVENVPTQASEPNHWQAPNGGAPSAEEVASQKEETQKRVSHDVHGGRKRLLAWTVMLSICFAMEVRLICPLAAGFDWEEFCGDRCLNRRVNENSLIASFWGSDCLACCAAIWMARILVILTGFFDIYYIFYLGTAVMGYAMGEKRGLRDILSATLAYVDLEISSSGNMTFLSGKAPKSADQSNKKKSKEHMTHGEAMQRVFGAAWRMIWSRCVEALYEDCLIKGEDADRMVEAASTVRWLHKDEVKKKDSYVAIHDTFTRIRFVCTKTRGERQGVAKQGRCISQLRVWLNPPEERTVLRLDEKDHECREEFKDQTVVVTLRQKEDYDKLLQALEQSQNVLKTEVNIGDTKVKEKFRLISGRSLIGDTEAERRDALQKLRDADSNPQEVVFKDPDTKFEEVEVELPNGPHSIHAVSFSTGNDSVDKEFDPVRWRIEGLLYDAQDSKKVVWKQLVWQDTDFVDVPKQRNKPLPQFFKVELWRKGGCEKNQSLELKPYCKEVQERLCFFTRSLRTIESKRYPIHEDERLLECLIGKIPPLSQIIPVYSETVYMSAKVLRESDGVNTNLGFMISQFPQEWEHFAEKHENLLREVLGRQEKVAREDLSETMYKAFIDYQPSKLEGAKRQKAKELIMEVRHWASMRSQTVARTVVGAIQYHEVLANVPVIQNAEDFKQAMEHCVELVLAHQTYGSQSCKEEMEEDVRYLLQKYRQFPFFLVFDYDGDKAKPAIRAKVEGFMNRYHDYQGRVRFASVRARYIEKQEQEIVVYKGQMLEYHTEYSLKFLSHAKLKELATRLLGVLGAAKVGFHESTLPRSHWELVAMLGAAYANHLKPELEASRKPGLGGLALPEPTEDNIEIIEVLPKQYPLRLGSKGFETQGKAGNQLGALRFARGHFLQMMDANMGAFLGEAVKVPFVLRRFQPYGTNRCLVEARIIGFREAIFTSSHGKVGKIMASAEWSFGTICQRFLKGLGMRMHYGHPDFLDGFWASNRGSLSKASPSINLSEDIFAGFNVSMRGERSKHVDYLSWEKGRESSFNAAALFFTKVSKGNVGVMRSRDIKLITENLNVVDSFSFYFASVGFYLNNLLIDFSVTAYVFLFVLLTLASKTLEEVGLLDSMLATEWIFSLGIVAMFPRFMELILEYGPLAGIIEFVKTVPSCMLMFTFINKSIASGVAETVLTGEADYIATGRPNANTHYTWRECYFIHCKSHYYPALRVIMCYILYRLLTAEYNMSSLPMFMVLVSCALWIVAPILYCPQPTAGSIHKDLTEFWHFIIAFPDIKDDYHGLKSMESRLRTNINDPRSTLYEFWLKEELAGKKALWTTKIVVFFINLLKFIAVVAVCYSSMLDNIWNMFLLLSVHVLLMEMWRILNHSAFIMVISLLMWLLVPPVIWPQTGYVNMLTTFIVLVLFLEWVSDIIKMCRWLYTRMEIGLEEKKLKIEDVKASRMKRYKEDLLTDEQILEKEKLLNAERARRYDNWVQLLYENFLGHQLHLYCALAVMLAFLVTQVICLALEKLCGLHSVYVLNGRLRSNGCCGRRDGYVPRRMKVAEENVWDNLRSSFIQGRGSRAEAVMKLFRSNSRGSSFEGGTPSNSLTASLNREGSQVEMSTPRGSKDARNNI